MAKKNYDNVPVTDKNIPSKDKVKRYDFSKKVKHVSPIFYFIERLVAKQSLKLLEHMHTYKKVGMDGLEPPYLILGYHMSYLDLSSLVYMSHPVRVNNVSALDALYDYSEFLMRNIGIIGKRKFIKDLHLLKNLKYSVTKLTDSAVGMYPEAKFSLAGVTSYLPPTLGKLVKFLDVPLVIAKFYGNYVAEPQWNKTRKIIPLTSEMHLIFTKEQVRELDERTIQKRIEEEFVYDDFKWQKDNNIIIDHPQRAEGLNKLLYQCAACGKEFEMHSKGTTLSCAACGKEWEMTELGELSAKDGKTEFSHIPDWFNWQKDNVAKEIAEGKYYFEDRVRVKTMPSAQKFYNQGEGFLVHDKDGFRLDCTVYGEKSHIEWKPVYLDGCHIEYNYKGEADAIDLSTYDDSYWLYPLTRRDVITKLSLATDELHRLATKK